MDDNVMRRYADKSTEAAHYVQYDQGKKLIRMIFH
jgi:chitin synthase